MLRIPGAPPVRTRLPLRAWAVAAGMTLFSLLYSLMHPQPSAGTVPSVEQGVHPAFFAQQEKATG